jgi:hypothetical protein
VKILKQEIDKLMSDLPFHIYYQVCADGKHQFLTDTAIAKDIIVDTLLDTMAKLATVKSITKFLFVPVMIIGGRTTEIDAVTIDLDTAWYKRLLSKARMAAARLIPDGPTNSSDPINDECYNCGTRKMCVENLRNDLQTKLPSSKEKEYSVVLVACDGQQKTFASGSVFSKEELVRFTEDFEKLARLIGAVKFMFQEVGSAQKLSTITISLTGSKPFWQK